MDKVKKIKLIILACILTILVIYRDCKLEERKNIKYYTIHESAEAHRADIKDAYKYWNKMTGIKFIEKYKPFRTVEIFGSEQKFSPRKRTIGVYRPNKTIVIYDQSRFYNIVLHEIGHSIGINHNKNHYDIMYPTIGHLLFITPTSLKDLEKAMKKKNYLLFY